jgi:hypothetical protein
MSDEEKVESSTAEEVTQTEAETTEAPEAEATEEVSVEAEENRIPQSRFSKVIRERNEAREELEELKAKAAPPPEPEEQTDDTREAARKMIEQDAEALLERKLGMSLDEIKNRLTGTEQVQQDHAERQWARMCEPHGLDATSEDLQAYVGGLVKYQNVPTEKALERASKIFGKATSEKPSASVESDTVTGTMTTEDKVFWDAKSATEAAKKGIKGRHVPLDEIVSRIQEKTKAG